MATNEADARRYAVAAIGDTGRGKTSLLNKLFPTHRGKVADSGRHVTKRQSEKVCCGVDGKFYTVIDTPGNTLRSKNWPNLVSYAHVCLLVLGGDRPHETLIDHQEEHPEYRSVMVCVRGKRHTQAADDDTVSIGFADVTMELIASKLAANATISTRSVGAASAAGGGGGGGGSAAASSNRPLFSLFVPAAAADSATVQKDVVKLLSKVQKLSCDVASDNKSDNKLRMTLDEVKAQRRKGDVLLDWMVEDDSLRRGAEQNAELVKFVRRYADMIKIVEAVYGEPLDQLAGTKDGLGDEKVGDVVEAFAAWTQSECKRQRKAGAKVLRALVQWSYSTASA